MFLPELLAPCRVLPVVTALDVESTVALGRTLAAGGMKALEITLRTDAALESIAAVKAELPDLVIAAGTVVNPETLEQAIAAGADCSVSPGLTPELLRSAQELGHELLPGVATASEVMLGMDYGLNFFKLFPAVAVGGSALLKSLAGPFPEVRFCPTGGLNPGNYRDYLALPNVVCCGGSWMADPALVKSGQWAEIERLGREAMTV